MRKHLIIAAVALSATSAFAAKSNDDVSSLKYLTPQSKFTLKGGVNIPISKKWENAEGFGGTRTTNSKFKGSDLELGAKYGVMQNLEAGLSTNFNYMNSRIEQSPNAGGTAERIQTGRFSFSKPAVNGTYRIKDDGEMITDGFLNWKTAFAKAKISTTTDQGNTLAMMDPAGHSFQLGAKFIKHKDDCEFSIAPYIVLSAAGDWQTKNVNMIAGSSTITSGTTESDFDFGLDLNYRHQFQNKIYGGLGLRLSPGNTISYGISQTEVQSNGTSATTAITGVTTNVSTPFHMTPKAVVGYSFEKNMALDLTGTYDAYMMKTYTRNMQGTATAFTLTQVKDWSAQLALNYML